MSFTGNVTEPVHIKTTDGDFLRFALEKHEGETWRVAVSLVNALGNAIGKPVAYLQYMYLFDRSDDLKWLATEAARRNREKV